MKVNCVTDWSRLSESALVIVPCWDARRTECCARPAEQTGSTPEQLATLLGRAAGNRLLLHRPPLPAIELLGIGKELDADALRRRLTQCLRSASQRPESVGIDISFAAESSPDSTLSLVQASVEGCLLGDYDPGALHQTAKGKRGLRPEERGDVRSVTLLVPPGREADAEGGAHGAAAVGLAQREILDLVNQPGNVLTPERLAEAVQSAGSRDGYQVTVLDKKAIQSEGLEALLAVNRGSSLPPVLIVMEYRPEEHAGDAPIVGLVGKGITFDTGGISLKPRENMMLMKSDMAGAAAVIGTLGAVARMRLPVHLVGVIPSTDNKPDGAALSPGDVIGSLAGVTIEVDDTDAEGRLILADGLAYLKRRFQPGVMIDLATLTGACVVALGNQAAGMFTDNDQLARDLVAAGKRSGERLWRLPLWPAYDRQIESDIADVKNTGGRGAGAVTAARFLSRFAGDHPAWAHLDIAGVAFPEVEGSRFRTATGFGVRVLSQYLLGLSKDHP